jgi:hypothetical protein
MENGNGGVWKTGGERQLCHKCWILNRGRDDVRGGVQATSAWVVDGNCVVSAPPQRPRATIEIVDLPPLGIKSRKAVTNACHWNT